MEEQARAGTTQPGTERHQTKDSRLMEEMRSAERALLSRPTLSLRFRLVVSFLLCFFLSGAIAIASVVILYQVRFKLQFLETTDTIAFEVQQARRFEKNYFLYGTDLSEALSHAQSAQSLLESESGNILEVVGESNLSAMTTHLAGYVELLERFDSLERSGGWAPGRKDAMETELRDHGSQISSLAETLTAKERTSVNNMIKASQIVPVAFLGILLILILFIVRFLNRAIMAPMKRFQSYTRRIAAGDFSPILPARRYRDEFSDLALALNRMLIELKTHEENCIQAAKMGAVGTLTSGIAHELNNPLNNVSLTTESLMENFKTLDDEQKWKLLQDIYFETERASETVKSLLDFTREEKPDMAPLDISEIIQSTLRLVQNEMAINNVTFTSSLSPDLPRVNGSPNQLRQVFLNLFINSIQAMPQGGTLTVEAFREDERRLCVEVRDTGTGISPENVERVFEPFFTTKEPGRGTGLGLSVSYSIIRKHGGEILVASETGKGTSMQVYLPLAEAADRAHT